MAMIHDDSPRRGLGYHQHHSLPADTVPSSQAALPTLPISELHPPGAETCCSWGKDSERDRIASKRLGLLE